MGNRKPAAGPATDVKGPDNNKRLAALEEGVSLLAVALAGVGVTIGEGDDPIAAAIAQLESKEQLQAESAKLGEFLLANHSDAIEGSAVDTAIKLLEAAKVGPDNATEGEVAAIARAERAELELAGAREDLELALSEKNRLAAELAGNPAAPASISSDDDTPIEAPAPAVRERPEAARDFGPTFGKLDSKDFAELLGRNTELEIAFSNGVHEIVELAPVKIRASDLSASSGRRVLNVPILVRGAVQHEVLHGVALVHEGEQIHYCEFPTPIGLDAGQERQFVKAIIFG